MTPKTPSSICYNCKAFKRFTNLHQFGDRWGLCQLNPQEVQKFELDWCLQFIPEDMETERKAKEYEGN